MFSESVFGDFRIDYLNSIDFFLFLTDETRNSV